MRDDLEEIISDRLQDMITWREKASALAKLIVENDDKDARLLSVEIFKDASTSQALPETVIKAYSSDRSRENFERIRHIIGITADQFQDIVAGGANYKMWIHVQKFGYFGVLVNADEIPIEVLLFRYFDNKVISDVRLRSKYSSVRLPSFDDWYQTRTYRVYLDAGSFSAFRITKKESEHGWNLFDKADTGAELIFGDPSVIPHLGPDEFLNYYGMQPALDTRKDGSEVLFILDMYKRSKGFNISRSEGLNLSLISNPRLRGLFVNLVNAAVQKNEESIQKFIDSSIYINVGGKIAAAVLHPSFTIVAKQPKKISTENKTEELVEILCRYQRHDGIMRECSFVFRINRKSSQVVLHGFKERR